VQKLHGYFTDYGEDINKCSGRQLELLGSLAPIENGRKATGCYYVRLVKVGDDDYYWAPMFTQERTPWGWLNIYKDQRVPFTEHPIAMQDWQKYKAGLLGTDGPGFTEKFVSETPSDYTDLVTRLEAGEVVAGSKYNLYFNYLLPTDTILKDDWSSKLPLYEGNLPSITEIHNTYQYEFIQFGKGVNLDSLSESNWQSTGSLWGTNAGTLLEGSTLVQFVLASQVGDPDDHIKASKAALMQEKYRKAALPKNLILIECGISDDLSTIIWCRFQQGMFTGNNAVAAEIASVSSVPFTPEAFFGNITAISIRTQNIEVGKRFDVKVTYDQSGVMGKLFEPDRGFKRNEMAGSAYLDTLIKPSQAQMDKILSDAIANVWKTIGGFYVLLLGAIAKLSKKD
jgi:hypothetical protein